MVGNGSREEEHMKEEKRKAMERNMNSRSIKSGGR
jgi:hypothetical protein